MALEIVGIRLNRLHNIRADSEYLIMEPGEHLHFYVRTRCANGPPQTAIFFAVAMKPDVGYGIEIVRIA
jgi:hypothetical protein